MNPKREFLEQALNSDYEVLVVLDSRYEGVALPPHLMKSGPVNLKFDLKFRLPEFDISDTGIVAALSFNRQDFRCIIPWGAVFQIRLPERGLEGLEFRDSVPEDLKMMGHQHVLEPEEKQALAKLQMKMVPTLVQGPDRWADQGYRRIEVFTNDAPETSAPKRGHLRLVKEE